MLHSSDVINLGSYAIHSLSVKTNRDEEGRMRRDAYFVRVKPDANPGPPLDPSAAFRFQPSRPHPDEPMQSEVVKNEGGVELTRHFLDFCGDGRMDSREATPRLTFNQDMATVVCRVVEDDSGKKSNSAVMAVPVGCSAAGDTQIDSKEDIVSTPQTGQSINPQPYWGKMFRHDSDVREGLTNVVYPFEIGAAGTYAAFVFITEPGGRPSKTPVSVQHADGEETVVVNQNALNNPFGLVRVGNFRFEPVQPAIITIGDQGPDGQLISSVVGLVKLP
ncbi:MAG: hypothetical protein Fur0032_23160 [Terrimicrobiaceae bacterium]